MSQTFDYDHFNTPLAQDLRKRMTKEEKKLWYDFLSLLPFTVHRQKTIGSYIVDFYIPKYKTVIELDGIQHSFPEEKRYDAYRTDTFEIKGISVLRYENTSVQNAFRSVTDDIIAHLGVDSGEIYEYIEKRKAEKR
ncbi:MAG: DUF559 domain-containing protein [Clostridia bacterium]|nr:DUF559 domain-containing protein [Clostridia bacterium]